MYYRKTYTISSSNKVLFDNYVNKTFESKIKELPEIIIDEGQDTKKIGYDFESTMEYYDSREENFIVGIIDKNVGKMTSYETGEVMDDVFKVRDKLKKDAK